MIITNLSIAKMAKDDPRCPDSVPEDCPYLYCLDVETDIGPLESAFFVREEMTADLANAMLRMFGKGLQRRAAGQAY